MRTTLLLCAALLLFAQPEECPAQAKPLPQYTDATASEHIGEEAAVTGKLVAITKTQTGTTFLNFGGRFPNQTFTGVIFSDQREKVGEVQTYEGKTVTITGRIELSREKPQIVIRGPEQIKLAEPGTPAVPATPMPTTAAPTATPATTPPTPAAPPAAAPPTTKPADGRKIVLAPNWNSPAQGGTMTRKDLALLFSGQGSAGEGTEGDASIIVYGGIPFLTPLAEARKRLNLEGSAFVQARVTCPGLPLGSFATYAFSGIFEGGFNRLILVTDNADQVVSALVLDENSRQRVKNETDSTGYHTYNFIQHRVKGTADLVIKHEIVPGTPKVVVVDSTLIDPNDPETSAPRTSGTRSTTSTRSTKPRTGKVLERSRWYVPVPVVNLILRCVGSR